jgi:predicted transcriptional regulator
MTDTPQKVVPIKASKAKKADTRKASEKKFGKPVMDLGFCITPSLLMQAQGRIGLNSVQFNIIMHLIDIWWDADRLPFPTKKLIADRIGLSERQVQRQIVELERAGLVVRRSRTRSGGGTTSNEYDMSGLVSKLRELEPEFKQVRDENRKRRTNVTRPAHKREA